MSSLILASLMIFLPTERAAASRLILRPVLPRVVLNLPVVSVGRGPAFEAISQLSLPSLMLPKPMLTVGPAAVAATPAKTRAVGALAQVRAAAPKKGVQVSPRKLAHTFDGGGGDAPEVFSPENIDHLSGPAIRAFFRMSEIWGLNETQQSALLGDPPAEDLANWRRERDAVLNASQLERVSYLLGIYKALRIIYGEDARGLRWLNAANKGFQGDSGLQVMLTGKEGLKRVRRYLDYWAYNGW